MITNRAVSSIEKGMEKGENTFVFYGEYISDWFYYDMYNGVMSLKESYKHFFLFEKGFDFFVWYRNSNLEVYRIENGEAVLTTELTVGKRSANSASSGLSLKNKKTQKPDSAANADQNNENSNTAEKAANDVGSADKAAFLKAVDFCKKNKSTRMAFFFEDFDWTSGMFKSTNDSELYVVEDMLDLRRCNNCVVAVSISDAEMLKRYNFNVDKNNVEMLASPSVDEIWMTYIRKYFRTYCKKKSISAAQMSELHLIAESIGSGEKSLKEAIRVFDRVMKKNGGVINKDDFSGSIEKAIEEKVRLDDVVIDEKKKSQIVQRVDTFLKADDPSKVLKGMLLAGPPGTGKTFLVKALANEKNCFFMSPSLAELKGEYVGQTSAKVKRIFQKARANAPTILFIDEADTVFQTRDQSSESDSFTKDMVNQFLVEMDGMSAGTSKVFVIAATNRVGSIDSAIMSRLDKPIEILLPDKQQRRQLFSNHLSQKGVERFKKCSFFDGFLDKTNRMSGRDIKNFIVRLSDTAKSMGRPLDSFVDEKEIQTLFNDALKAFEDELIRKLSDELHIAIKRPTQNEDLIIGCEEAKNAIAQQVKMFDPVERAHAKSFGVELKRGILLYGPPGNGKSFLAENTASRHNLLFVKVTSDTFTKASLSETSQVLLRIFSGAVQLSELCTAQNGVMLFFDEFDSLASVQLLDGRLRGTLLTQLDDKNTMRDPSTKVLFVAATNFIELLDEATIRTGRIDEKIRLNNPSEEEGRRMIIQFCKENPHVEEIDDDLAQKAFDAYKSVYRSNAITGIIEKNRRLWLESGKELVELKQYAERLVEGTMSPSSADLRSYVNHLFACAYNESSISQNRNLIINERIIDLVCGKES